MIYISLKKGFCSCYLCQSDTENVLDKGTNAVITSEHKNEYYPKFTGTVVSASQNRFRYPFRREKLTLSPAASVIILIPTLSLLTYACLGLIPVTNLYIII